MGSICVAALNAIGVLVADSNQMQCQFLASALRRRVEFRVASCALAMDAILSAIVSSQVQVAIMNAGRPKDGRPEMTIVRRLHLAHPEVAKILLLDSYDREVVVLVADGLSNREVAHELSLSEHTIKKYLFRIFDKLGISSRVELVLYAVSHGGSRQAEWLAGAGA